MLDNPMLHFRILEMSIPHQLCCVLDRRVERELCSQGKCLMPCVVHHKDQRMQEMQKGVSVCIRKLLPLTVQLVVVAMSGRICSVPLLCMIQLIVRAHAFLGKLAAVGAQDSLLSSQIRLV